MSPCMIKAVPIILPKFALVGSDQAPFRLRDLKFKSRNNVTDRPLLQHAITHVWTGDST